MKVTRIDDVKVGLERLGLTAEIGDTKAKNWKRIYIHVPNYKYDPKTGTEITLYLGRMSFENGILQSWKLFGIPSYWACAINLMIHKAVILNHINYYALHQKAYNEAYHLKETSESCTSKKEAAKLLREFYAEKFRAFTRLFTTRYGTIKVHC